jgi:hypothetical protein
MIWANFLHIYQPPTQKPYWVNRVTDESYRKIFHLLLKNPTARTTMNINGVLLDLLNKNGHYDVIDAIKKLVSRGQLELTGSAKYHPLLPFLPESEIIRQIKLNEETVFHYLGSGVQLKGFFPPEMGFSIEIARIVADLGYQWIIVDELSFPKNQGPQRHDRIYQVANLQNFHIFFRERRMSWVILSGQIGTGKLLIQSLGERLKKNEYLLTAMDGETFGHHRPGLETLLFEIYKSDELQTVKISDLPNLFARREETKPLSSTWALMEKDLEKEKPFARWYDEENTIHQAQWGLTKLAIETVQNMQKDAPGYEKVRQALDMALHSDQYWWASARPWWSIEMIERGAKDLYDVVVSASGVSEKIKKKAETLYHKIVFTAFEWQRSGLVEELSHTEDEEVRQRTDEGLPRLPKKEIEKMIRQLKKEMKLVASRQEFERAAQIRDRIRELRKYTSEEDFYLSAEGNQEFTLKKYK